MSTKAKVITGIAAVVVVLGWAAIAFGPAFYRDVIVGPAAADPVEEFGTLAPSTLTADELAGDWTVSDGSYAGYRVDEVLNGTDITVTARTETVAGTVTATSTEITAATIDVDVASIATDEAARDQYFRTQAINTAQYPTATFVLTQPIAAMTVPDSGEAQTVSATGTLTLNGVSNDVTVEITAALDGDNAKLAGQIPITFSDFNVTAPSLGFVKVEDTGYVEFLLELAKA
ncbi:YceI family protein [Leifsonia sp. A12D58]|uniref:YceI family protein n=1 Tax=Leifsonia sp. A12D58 TaxID=3397674 RepID=UPI0039DF836E